MVGHTPLQQAKIRLVQMVVQPGRPDLNASTMLQYIATAKRDKIDLLIFPEMCLPGYLLGDEWERSAFLRACEIEGLRIADAADGICVVYGNIAIDWDKKNEDGRSRKYNAVFVAEGRKWIRHSVTRYPFFIKTLMPNYREFDDNRYFYDPRKLAYELNTTIDALIEPVPTSLGLLGCMLCEDGWDADYNISPSKILAAKKADILINLSSSPHTHNKISKRHRVFGQHAKDTQTPLLYINHCGIQDNGKTVFTFDGSSSVYDTQGQCIQRAGAYSDTHLDVQFGSQPQTQINQDGIAELYQAIRYGTEQFMQRLGVSKVVVGVSGGIDSAVVAALYRSFLPADQLLLVSMPGPFTSDTTRSLAKQLAEQLDCYFDELPIEDVVDATRQQLADARFTRGRSQKKLPISDFVMENIQARDRSSRVLAGIAAAFGGVFTCNANKSETTVGYSTLYGDLGGYLANIADLWKGEVYALADYLNKQVYGTQVIPQGILDIVPSAELSSKQNVDLRQGDPLQYAYHDRLFASWVERWERATPEDILQWYVQGELEKELQLNAPVSHFFDTPEAFIQDLEYWWRQYQGMAIAKRIQAPPILAVKRRAFGFDHREAQLGARFTPRYHALRRQVIESGNTP